MGTSGLEPHFALRQSEPWVSPQDKLREKQREEKELHDAQRDVFGVPEQLGIERNSDWNGWHVLAREKYAGQVD